MEKKFLIDGMTCQACVQRVSDILNKEDNIEKVSVQLTAPQASIQYSGDLNLSELNTKLGHYTISNFDTDKAISSEESSYTYKPLFLVVGFILIVCLSVQFPFSDFSASLFMQHFMAGFFIAFSFFKFLDLKGFANSFSQYDILAKRLKLYAQSYPFIELFFGLAYLINFKLQLINIAVIIVLGIGTIGVIQSNLQKTKIQCACLGTVFNLPMSKLTIIENVSMILMAILMLL